MAVKVDIREETDVLLIDISGRIISDEHLSETLGMAQGILDKKAFKAVICKCSKLEYINSSGLNFFVRLLTRSRNHNIDCLLVDLQPAVSKLFSISKLNEVFCILKTVEEAKQVIIEK